MGKTLIIKVGTTLPTLLSYKGDFEDWIFQGLGIDQSDVQVIDARDGGRLPAPDPFAGVVITGSHAYVTDHEPWSERTAEWLRQAVARQVPLLGVCYGHQLLAYALGGAVGDNPQGYEFGTVPVHLTSDAKCDLLLSDYTSPIRAHVSHAQSVLQLPEGAKRLAYSAHDENQAFVVGSVAWGVQFHPEFDAEIVAAYIESHTEPLREQGQDPDELLRACEDTPCGSLILKRFAAIANHSQP
jgi:GMP synthase (glutamine-hydrolysing)